MSCLSTKLFIIFLTNPLCEADYSITNILLFSHHITNYHYISPITSTSPIKHHHTTFTHHKRITTSLPFFSHPDVTAIEDEGLAVFAPSLCSFSPPLETPEPHYDPDRDAILCHCTATYGTPNTCL